MDFLKDIQWKTVGVAVVLTVLLLMVIGRARSA